MRMLLACFCALLCVLPPLCARRASLSVGADVMLLDALWSPDVTFRLETVLCTGDAFAFRFPISYAYRLRGADVSCFEWGVMVDYYPFSTGLFVSLGMFQSAYFFGPDKPEEDHLYLHEIAVGWTVHVTPSWYVEPKIRIIDPTGVFASESALWRRTMGDRPDVRFSLVTGLSISAPWLAGGSEAATGRKEER